MNTNKVLRVELSDLRKGLDAVVSHLENRGIESVEISDDYYWDISPDQMYNPLEDPTSFELGQLTHDLERISKIIAGETEPIGYALVWLGAILRAIGKDNVR